MAYKRILSVQDISCVGKCSMSVALPILSAFGHEVCILPTAVLSTHTGMKTKPAVHHLDSALPGFREHWERESVRFDIISTGYLGNIGAIDEVLSIADKLLAPGGILIVDPAMADHGKLYSGLDDAYAEAMYRLCVKADILLPNVTEAAMLAGIPYGEVTERYVSMLLQAQPCDRVILTGIGYAPDETGAEIREGDIRYHYRHRRFPKNYHGTGDIFAACVTGAIASGKDLVSAARIAADFTAAAIETTWNDPSGCYGVKFEPCLYRIHEMLK